MNTAALILAAHGSRRSPAANHAVQTHVHAIRSMNLFAEVTAAFHQGTPTFAAALDHVTADDVIVVPVMTSDGFYADTVLPRAIASNRRLGRARIRRTRPVGTHPAIAELVANRCADVLGRFNLPPDRTSLVLVGHGTVRHRRSATATVDLADALGDLHVAHDVLPAFLDQPPYVDDILTRVTQPNVVVLPFLIGGGLHAVRDIPSRLGIDPPPRTPHCGVATGGGPRVVFDIAVGEYPEITNLIIDLAATTGTSHVPTAIDLPAPRAADFSPRGLVHATNPETTIARNTREQHP